MVGLVYAGASGVVFAAPPESAGSCTEGTVVSSIGFTGLEHTKPRVVQRELLNRVGEPFSYEKFELEKRRLQDLDLFTEVEVSCEIDDSASYSKLETPNSKLETPNSEFRIPNSKPKTPNSELRIPNSNLTYRFTEIFRWIPAPASKTTDRDGLMLGLALANLNILGEDIRAEVQYRTTVDPFLKNNEYVFYASSPYFFGLPLGWNFEFSRTDSDDDIRGFTDRNFLIDLDLDWAVLPHLSLLWTVAACDLDNADFLPEFGFGFAFDFRDAKIDSRQGVYFEYMLTHVGLGDAEESGCGWRDEGCKDLGGENYWEFLTDARAYYSLWRFVTGATALVRYRPGEVKFYDYYAHGGKNTFRGHYAGSYSLGVHEALLTLEERFVLLDRQAASVWGVNFFYGVQLVAGLDGSLLWNEGAPGWEDYEGAVYGGVHLVIPALDRVRFEVGYSPDRKEPKFHFGIMDKVTASRWRNR